MKSMTGYARAEHRTERYDGVVEIRCYNSKNLDMALHIARAYLPLEGPHQGRCKWPHPSGTG